MTTTSPHILIPSNGTTRSGSTYLDAAASNATNVEFLLFGGTYGFSAPVICTATPTIYGWLCSWNTTTVPNGSYVLVSEASNSAGGTFSSGVNITVGNPPTTTVLIPSNGTPLSGPTFLDAAASNATDVQFLLFGGIYGYDAPVICTATPTIYGWLCSWNTTTVPNGSYILASKAFNSVGSTVSSGVNVTVHNSVTYFDLAGSFSGTESHTTGNGCSALYQVFDATYPGSSAVGSVTLHLSGCVLPTSYTGTFSIATSVGTLSGDVAGSISNLFGPGPIDYELTLSVLSETGAFAGAAGGINVSILVGSPVTGSVTVP